MPAVTVTVRLEPGLEYDVLVRCGRCLKVWTSLVGVVEE